MKFIPLFIALALGLAGCAGDPSRLSVTAAPSEMSVRVAVRSILVGEIALPEYANAQEVVRQSEDGLIEAVPGVIWADIPEDAMANALVRNLSQITNASVARAPWPLANLPDAELTVRVEQMLVRFDGQLSLSGQFAVRRDDGPWGERLRTFEIAVPTTGQNLPDLADAHAVAWRQLAEQIARQL
ncbi:PqiC family protein [Gymnodinialimonas sp. 2305UL16-5]|uniref:PqiC family protein n=1 Tax=Gymnodinialimonas mytili TaxID=3126503 RepID=UPI0030AD07F8